MANWCSNIVTFHGDKIQVNRTMFLFKQLERKEEAENKGQLPDFISAEDGYFFEIWTLANILNYETRWSPNTDVLKQVADHFKVEFLYEYVEPMNGIHGKIAYRNGVLTKTDRKFKT